MSNLRNRFHRIKHRRFDNAGGWKLRKTDVVKTLLAASFPKYRGRTFELVESTSVWFDPYGGGGTNSKFVLYELATGRSEPYRKPLAGPFGDPNAFRNIPLADGVVLIEHGYFCGRDTGITFHVTPQTRALVAFAPLEISA